MTPLRSLLFVPGDSARKQQKALASDADALILDLEDSVDPANLPDARARVAELLRSQAAGRKGRTTSSWVAKQAIIRRLRSRSAAPRARTAGPAAGRASGKKYPVAMRPFSAW